MHRRHRQTGGTSLRDYYRLLLDVTTAERWEDWTLYVLEAIRETATWTSDKVRAAQALLEHTVQHVQRQASNIYTRELVEQLFEQPYCRIANLVDSGLVYLKNTRSGAKNFSSLYAYRAFFALRAMQSMPRARRRATAPAPRHPNLRLPVRQARCRRVQNAPCAPTRCAFPGAGLRRYPCPGDHPP